MTVTMGTGQAFLSIRRPSNPWRSAPTPAIVANSSLTKPRFLGSCSSYSTLRRARKSITLLALLLSLSASHQPSAGPRTERSYRELWKVSIRVKRSWYALRVTYAIRHALTGVQDLFDESDADSQEDGRRQAQIYDDTTLLRELRDSISTLISEDPNRHVLSCPVFIVINLFHRYPSYVKNVATTFITLQSSVLGQSPADVGSHSPERPTSIDISDTVVHGYHNPNKYACRGRTENGEDSGLGNRLPEPSQVKARMGGRFSVRMHFAICSP